MVLDQREKRKVILLGETIMFEHLAKHDVILVSGPQRSGTRIAAKMIAADTGHRYVDEDEFKVYSRKRFDAILQQHRIVVQCPTLCHILHEVATNDTLVVMMLRNMEDIVASEKRINWTGGAYRELANFGMSRQEARKFRQRGGQIAPLKYARWWGHQRKRVPQWLELEYESLAAHPLWVPKEQRAEFKDNQTEIG